MFAVEISLVNSTQGAPFNSYGQELTEKKFLSVVLSVTVCENEDFKYITAKRSTHSNRAEGALRSTATSEPEKTALSLKEKARV